MPVIISVNLVYAQDGETDGEESTTGDDEEEEEEPEEPVEIVEPDPTPDAETTEPAKPADDPEESTEPDPYFDPGSPSLVDDGGDDEGDEIDEGDQSSGSLDSEAAPVDPSTVLSPVIQTAVKDSQKEHPNIPTKISSLISSDEVDEETRIGFARELAAALDIDPDDPEVLNKVKNKLAVIEVSNLGEVDREVAVIIPANCTKGAICGTDPDGMPLLIPTSIDDVSLKIPPNSLDHTIDVVDDESGGPQRPFITVTSTNDRERTPKANTDAIQAAIDDAAERGGGVVYLPPGTYVVDKKLNMKDGVTLMGDPAGGTIIRMSEDFTDEDNGALIANDSKRGNQVMVVRDLTLEGNSTQPPDHNRPCVGGVGTTCSSGIRIRGATQVVIDGVKISGFSGDGISISNNNGGLPSTGVRVNNADISRNGRNGISIVNGESITVSNSRVNENNQARIIGVGVAGIAVEPEHVQRVNGVVLVGNEVSGNRNNGIQFVDATDDEGNGISNVTVCSNQAKNNKADIDSGQSRLKITDPRQHDGSDGCTVGGTPNRPAAKKSSATSFDFWDTFLIRKVIAQEEKPTNSVSAIVYETEYKSNLIKGYRNLFGNVDQIYLNRVVNFNALDQKITPTAKGFWIQSSRSGTFSHAIQSGGYKINLQSIPGFNARVPKMMSIGSAKGGVIPVALTRGFGKVSYDSPNLLEALNLFTILKVPTVSALESDKAEVTAFGYMDDNNNGKLENGENIVPWAKLAIDLELRSANFFTPPFYKIEVKNPLR